MSSLFTAPKDRKELIWSVLGCIWATALLVHELPFLHWSHSPAAAAVLQFIAYLPLGVVIVAGFRALLLLAPEHAAESKNVGYIGRLDHLRFFAALLVVMYHFYHGIIPVGSKSDNPLLNLFGEGASGVDLFFVLSGFIFGLIGQGKKVHYGNFLFSRVVRIYPLYILGILIMTAANADRFSAGDVALLLFPFLDVDMLPGLPGFGQLWTIGLEFQFYLIFPLLLIFIGRHGPKYLIGIMVMACALRAFYFFDRGTVRDISQWSMIGRFDQFACGILAAALYFRRKDWLSSPLHLGIASIAVLGCFQWLNAWGGFQSGEKSALWIVWDTIEGVVWAYLILSYLSCRLTLPEFWDTTLGKLGQLSFSIYVFHSYAMFWALKRFGSSDLTGSREFDAVLLGLFVCVPLAIVIALPSYHLIEKQFFIFRRKYVETLPQRAP